MSTARDSFIRRIQVFRLSVDSETVVDRSPQEVDHNSVAQLMRNGLAIVGFAILEDFIRSRTGEVLARLESRHVGFANLPAPLQEAAVFGVVRALEYQAQIRRSDSEFELVQFLQRHGGLLASTADTAYRISELAYCCDKSNLGPGAIKDVLDGFLVKDCWGKIGALAGRVGLGSLRLPDALNNAVRMRHLAAHVTTAKVEWTHLESYYMDAIGIAIGFDALISHCLKLMMRAGPRYADEARSIRHSDIKIRYLDKMRGSQWREIEENAERAAHVAPSSASLWPECMARADRKHELLVMRDAKSIPVQWYVGGPR